ncbi:EF hand domain-containing protein [Magnaporthiopsis poae ATCC 64411]|uniref:EF hand domain-containing protein n=1 Tax=Magnaporthiopsis poae (strain ATCC 64411 / 73-15) TaxID=644358 RepID=A0A0C4EBR3_MAGP6|nr:EF hand domain-containing protein [Magnaporthiopsis poae ATCC 64411]
MRTGSPLGRSHQAPPGGDWLVTAADKARFDQEYAKLDKSNRGFITGEEAVPFFSQSRLPEDTLAQIWDLADLSSQGRLTRDEFAIAMYLIRQQRTSRDTPLPATLPQNLIPPSMRAHVRPPTATGPSAFDVPQQPPPPAPQPQPQPKSALDDLFGLDSPPTMPAAPVQKAVTTGGSNDPFGSNASPAPASPARPSPTASSFAPFVPSSSFGRTLTAQATGASTSSAGGMQRSGTLPPQAAAADDLLGDQDDAGKNLSNDTAELANLSNQITSLSKHVQDVRGQQATTQNELTQATAQKKNFEQRLSQLRAAYEKEAKDVRALEEQLNASRAETKKLQTEMAMLEGTYQDLQNQHRQVATALQADQQENANLKERIRVVNAEVAQLKPKIEKLRSEARQQKGLVAINKKQLATNEGERDKLNTEAEELAKSNEDMARQASTGSPVPAPAQVASPAPSSASVNNPFFRRTGSTDIMGAFASPAAKPFDKSFDDVFGPSPSFPASTGTPPPATAFGPQHTGASTGSAASSFATPATSNTPNLSRQATLGPNPIPPPPPQSRQISSSFLPFGEAPESITSSRQVSPPVSRMGQPDTPLAEAAAKAPAAAVLEPVATGQSVTSESQKAVDNRPTSSGSSAPKQGDAAGAPGQGRPHADSLSDPFSAVDQAKAKDDFESAFASFKNAHGKAAGGPSSSGSAPAGNDGAKGAFADAFNREFPPISELERDDYSDSDSEKDGFDDDFAPVSPPTNSAQPAKPSEATAVKPPAAEGATSEATASPTAATSSSSISTAMPAGQSNVNSIWGDSLAASASTAPAAGQQSEPASSAAAPPPLPAKQAFDDLEDDFEGLEDAKEGSTADDDFANISRSALDDFNPVFDSSPPRSHAAKSDGGSNNPAAGGAPNFAAESSSFDFAERQPTPAGPAAPLPACLGCCSWRVKEAPAPAAAAAAAATANGAPDPSGSPAPAPAASSSSPAAPVPSRPAAAGRLLTEGGEHDDPILKNLTGMGYPRADALSALEKYDYNLERAANYLANQS